MPWKRPRLSLPLPSSHCLPARAVDRAVSSWLSMWLELVVRYLWISLSWIKAWFMVSTIVLKHKWFQAEKFWNIWNFRQLIVSLQNCIYLLIFMNVVVAAPQQVSCSCNGKFWLSVQFIVRLLFGILNSFLKLSFSVNLSLVFTLLTRWEYLVYLYCHVCW